MITLVASGDVLLLSFSSDITFVDYAVDVVNNLLAHRGLAARTALLVVARELLKNAVVHGNRNDPEKTVTLRVERLSEGRYSVEAEDDGAGFDVADVCSGPTDAGERASGGRPSGFALIRALADHVEFGETGNRVTAYVDAVACSAS